MQAGDTEGESVKIKTPLGDEILDLRAGDSVLLSGTIYTARDEAHLRMMEEKIPFDPKGAAIYHCGPVIQDDRIIAAGPTTSARMNRLTAFLLDAGVRCLIGKGGMSDDVAASLKGRGIYLAFTGGCAALAASHMKLTGVFYPDLGMAEAVWVIEVNDLPLVVGIDAAGGNLFSLVNDRARERYDAWIRDQVR
ncbi:FumA C-terminus/TtdB family hydratase beta subunit [Methanocalculus sp.]|uniref:FumA C-terminus/TtdB family hydratase beta subunit n=1 Tax=Methanocalculus sp. TaxID=2004547 RepID=UPI0026067857|nr:FumA C-terminus/TtdB family hydratase beta subunit [Methanocalculus sp.]MDG6251785.1 FumA C-terminus/TtdB family hydratase beta subunit [Methanocalculus sp.]